MLFWAVLTLGGLWAGLALWVQFPQARLLALAALALLLIGLIALRLGSQWSWAGLGLASLLIGGWYLSLAPQQHRDWAADVAHIVKGEVHGDRVVLQNVRSFRWSSADVATESWTQREIDLTQLTGADMITSVWDNPKIAHLLVSFRFADQAPLTFSVEIRREKDERFSVIGGFFRQFELSLIAADEADILQWRAVPRGEDVRLYPLELSPEQLRELFLSYVALGNRLNEAPEWYNTVTANCTTVVWRLAKVLSPRIPLDPSLLASGLLPEFLQRMQALTWQGDIATIRERAAISDRARVMPEGADFSSWIRAGQQGEQVR